MTVPSRVGTEATGFADITGGNWSPKNVVVTIPSGCHLVLVSIAVPADKDEISTVVWDSASANQSLMLIDATASLDGPGDVQHFLGTNYRP